MANDEAECFITQIGLYAKNWYGHWSHNENNTNDIRKIMSVLCLMDEQYISEKDAFLFVHRVFHELTNSNPNYSYAYHDLMSEGLYPNTFFESEKKLEVQYRLMNEMLRIIAHMKVKLFPKPELPYHPELMKIFAVSADQITHKEKFTIK